MKKILYFLVVVVILISTSAFAFDSESYCKNVSDGSYQTEEFCLKQEEAARKELSGMNVPSEIEKHCKSLADNSYQTMLFCVQQEIAAKKRLGK